MAFSPLAKCIHKPVICLGIHNEEESTPYAWDPPAEKTEPYVLCRCHAERLARSAAVPASKEDKKGSAHTASYAECLYLSAV
eukprot:17677-Heterococcus_DN1.PRE.1